VDGLKIVVMDRQSSMKLFRLVKSIAASDIQTFTDPTAGFMTTDVHDVNGDIVRLNTPEDSLVWVQSGRYVVRIDTQARLPDDEMGVTSSG
jgi:hypothetical protein